MKNNLYYINLHLTKDCMNNLSNISSKKDLIQYYHQSMFGPTKDKFIKVYKKGFLRSFPGLTTDLINKHLPPEPAISKGYQKYKFKGIQSTKKPINSPKNEEPNIQSTLEPLRKRSNIVLINLDDLEKLTYSD